MEALSQGKPDCHSSKAHSVLMTMHEKLAHKIYDASTVRITESKLEKFGEKAGKRQRALYGLDDQSSFCG